MNYNPTTFLAVSALAIHLFWTALAIVGLLMLWRLSGRNANSRRVNADPAKLLPDGARVIPLDGSEVFFPPAGHDNPVYQVIITGVRILRGRRKRDELEQLDGFYKTNVDGRFDWRHYRLLVNNQPLSRSDYEFVEEDRCLHRYVFNVGKLKQRIGIAFEPPDVRRDLVVSGLLTASVTVLPADTLTRDQREREERARKLADRKAVEAKREAVANADQFAHAIRALTVRAETNRNWRDPEFQQKFARVNCDDLLKHQAEIRMEANQFLEQTRLVQHLRRHNPSVVTTVLGRLEALLIAENLALDKAIAAVEVSKRQPKPKLLTDRPKPKLTAEQVKQLKVRRQQILLGDKLALAKDRVATIEDVKAYVRAQYAHLAEDEQQAIIQQILDQVDEEESRDGKTL